MVHWQLDLEVKILSTRCKWSSVHHMPLPALVAFPGILNIFPAKYFTKICQIFATYLPSLQTFATSVWRKSEVLWTIPIDVQTKKNNPVQKVFKWPVNLFTLLFYIRIQNSLYISLWMGVGCKKGSLKGIEANENVAWSITTFSADKNWSWW